MPEPQTLMTGLVFGEQPGVGERPLRVVADAYFSKASCLNPLVPRHQLRMRCRSLGTSRSVGRPRRNCLRYLRACAVHLPNPAGLGERSLGA